VNGLAAAVPVLSTTAPAPALAAAQGSLVAPAASLSARDSVSGVASAAAPPSTVPGNEPNSASASTSTASSNSNASTGAAKPLGTPVARLQLPSSDADYLRNPQPEYPPLSRRLGEQGRVVVNVLIGTDGSAQKAEILSTSGFDRLDQAALSTVRAWRYVPGKRSGVPEAMWFAVPIQFVLQ
jgi:protein TonB